MRRIVRVGSALLFLVATMSVSRPQAVGSSVDGPLSDASALAVPGGAQAASVDPRLKGSKGTVEIVVGLIDAPLAVAHGRNFKQLGGSLNAGQQRAYLHQLAQKQDALMGQVRGLGGNELARVSKALNAVMISIDASRIQDVAALPLFSALRAFAFLGWVQSRVEGDITREAGMRISTIAAGVVATYLRDA